jgi:YcaO-like protein with predicted kinase domain
VERHAGTKYEGDHRAGEPGTDCGVKQYFSGTHRTRDPADTVSLVLPYLPAMGITRVANVTGLDRIGLPVVMVFRPNSRSVAVSQGKGTNLLAAKASGLMEAIETWHAERMTNPLKLASFEELREAHRIIDVERLPLLEGSFYHDDRPILWVEGVNLLDDEARWLPYEMVHSNYTLPRSTGYGCFPASTNGLASGNHFLEAVCHGVCEVIERDSLAVWHQLPPDVRAATRLDPDCIEDSECRDILEILRQADFEIAIWDMTSNINVAAFYCLLLDAGSENGHMGAGSGCHPVREIALSRALTESIQTRTTYVAGSRDDLSPQEFSTAGIRTKYDYAERLLRNSEPVRDFWQTPTFIADTLDTDLRFLLGQLEGVGVSEVVCIDLSKPEFDLSVVRVVIPGLEAPHDDDGYMPGPRAMAAQEGML